MVKVNAARPRNELSRSRTRESGVQIADRRLSVLNPVEVSAMARIGKSARKE
jgi:hypothetical protein